MSYVHKKRSWWRVGWKIVKSHFRRLPFEVINIFTKKDKLFWLVGVVNKRVNFIQSIFLGYPAEEKYEEYAMEFLYRWRVREIMWSPWFCGVIWQNRKLTMVFSITATDSQLIDSKNTENLKIVVDRMEKLRQLLGAKSKTFAGILPGVLYRGKLIHDAHEADLTAKVVVQAIDLVKAKESLDTKTPIIVLGGKGFIGRRVMKLLNESESTAYSIDLMDSQSNWPHLKGQSVVVVNIAHNSALKDFIEVFEPGTIILNEVYPEPEKETLERLRMKNCSYYHVAGAQAKALPSFTGAYKGAIPCCAAWDAPEIRAIILKMN